MSQAAILDAKRYRLDLSGTIVPASEWRNAEQASALLDKVNQALVDAREQVEEDRRKGFDQGFEEGRQAGLDALARAVAALVESRGALVASMRGQVAELAIAVVNHIAPKIGAEAMLPALAVKAVQQLVAEPGLLVRVHPDVADAVRERIASLDGVSLPKTEITGDEELSEFDCVIETQGGLVCAGLQEQLQQAATILARARIEPEDAEVPLVVE